MALLPSSPDCLDTTTLETHPSTGKARHLKSTRCTRGVSSSSTSSADSAATSTQLTTPDNLRANGRMVKNARSAADPLQGSSRDSPDPLDTISPAIRNATTRRNDRRPVKSDVCRQAQPSSARMGSERRSLRSTDSGFRCKSELAQYFNNYEQLIGLEDPKPGKSGRLSEGVLLVDVDVQNS